MKKTNINLLFKKEREVREIMSKLMKDLNKLKIEYGFEGSYKKVNVTPYIIVKKDTVYNLQPIVSGTNCHNFVFDFQRKVPYTLNEKDIELIKDQGKYYALIRDNDLIEFDESVDQLLLEQLILETSV